MGESPNRQPGPDERFCSECGEVVSRSAQECEHCRASLSPSGPPSTRQSGTGLDPNAAAALSYLLTWITGIIFLLVEKHSEYVRFHAKQSIAFGVAVVAVWIGFGIFTSIIAFVPFIGGVISSLLWFVVSIGFLVFWILLMVKAYQGQRFRLPVLSDVVDKVGGGAY